MLNNVLISDFTLTDNIPQYQNQTWTGEVITRMVGTQYFTLSFKATTNKSNRAELAAFIGQYSYGKPFTMPLGWWGTYTGTQTAGVQSTAARSAGASTIATNANTLEVGSLIQFNGHTKLYRVIATTGNALTIYPALIKNIQLGENIKYDNLQGSFILTPQNSTYALPSTNIMDITFTATENIRS